MQVFFVYFECFCSDFVLGSISVHDLLTKECLFGVDDNISVLAYLLHNGCTNIFGKQSLLKLFLYKKKLLCSEIKKQCQRNGKFLLKSNNSFFLFNLIFYI